MKPVKITAEITLTPEMYKERCCEEIQESEQMYQQYVKKTLYSKFGAWRNIGGYEDFINKTIDNNGNGLKLTVEELK